MDSFKLSDFLFTRVQETIDYKQCIEEVSIGYFHTENYGNEYIRVSYEVAVNENYEKMPLDEQKEMFLKARDYTFSLSTHKENFQYSKKKKLLRFIEFRHIYESLASYAVLQLERHLKPGTPIKAEGIDLWPEANYVEKYILSGLYERYNQIMHSDFKWDTSQWDRLHQLAKKSVKIYRKEKEKFNITDIELNDLFDLKLDTIRSTLLHNEIPIKIKGIKTIDEIFIHSARLVKVLKKEINNNEYVQTYKLPIYKRMITYLYDNYLTSEKERIINYQQSNFLMHFIIQPGDILQLNDMRIVMANSISIDARNKIKVEYVILKNNLDPGQRTRAIGFENILYLLRKDDFSEFVNKNSIKHQSSLNRWMSKRKMKLNFTPFLPDLTEEIDDNI